MNKTALLVVLAASLVGCGAEKPGTAVVSLGTSDTFFAAMDEFRTDPDGYGHVFGNELIITTAKIISETFKRSPVFRIGGDEFCVILQNKDLADKNKLFVNFDSQCATTYIENDNVKFPVSVAKGFSKFDCTTDSQFLEVFERADSEMYKNKRTMKSLNS